MSRAPPRGQSRQCGRREVAMPLGSSGSVEAGGVAGQGRRAAEADSQRRVGLRVSSDDLRPASAA